MRPNAFLLTLLFASAIVSTAVAQSVTATATALTQVIAQADTDVDARPAGTDLSAGLVLDASGVNGFGSPIFAHAEFGVATIGGTITYTIVEDNTAGGPTGGVGGTGPHETVLTLASAQPVPGVVTVQWSSPYFGAAGAQVDFGNDGVFDWAAPAFGSVAFDQVVTVDGTFAIRTRTSRPIGSGQTLQVQFSPLVESNGAGCVTGHASFYELISPFAMDLAGKEVVLDDYGGGFLVSTRPGTIQPIGSVGPAVMYPLSDDGSIAVGTLGMEIKANGQVAFGPWNDNWHFPDVTTMLQANPATALYAWTDLDPSAVGSGGIWYEENGLDYQVTYDGVFVYGTTQPATVQFRGNRGYNDHVIAFGAIPPVGLSWLVGYSPGGPNTDPGPIDFSALAAVNPHVSREPDTQSLVLTPASAPLLGTMFEATTAAIEAGALFHLGLIGFADPALPLGFLGLDPSCVLHATPDIFVGPAVVVGLTSLTWTVADLNTGAVSGLEFEVQALTMDLSLLSGTTRLSNGMKVTVR